MPILELPLLELDAQKISQLNPRNVESLFGLWTVFNKCSGSIEGGKRYENMSWRLWNRETFCCPPQPQLSITPAIDVHLPRPSAKDIPELSSSVDSISSDVSKTAMEARILKAQKIPQQRSYSPDSALSRSRGKEKHLTAQGLEKMVVSISTRTKLEPLSPTNGSSRPKTADATPRPSSPQLRRETEEEASGDRMQRSTDSGFSTATASTTTTARQSDHRGSDTSVSSDGLIRTGSVVHGFSPSPIPASFRTKSKIGHAMPVPASKSSMKNLAPKKPNNMFTLGGSSGDDESSFEDRMHSFKPQRSSLSESLTRPIQNQNKKASFRDIVNARQQELKEGSDQDEDAIETDDEDDVEDVTDSAIEEDDEDAEWEDDEEDSKQAVEDANLFKRVDSRPALVSRPSMLTMAIHRNSSAALNNNTSPLRSTPALRRSQPSSPTGLNASIPDGNDEDNGLTLRVPQGTLPRTIIPPTSNTYGLAQSPRTTRRNMLATELTESLRKNLLWERRQKSSTANAVFKRRHTAQNMAGLEEYPGGEAEQAGRDPSRNNSWNHIFDAPWEYHTKGW